MTNLLNIGFGKTWSCDLFPCVRRSAGDAPRPHFFITCIQLAAALAAGRPAAPPAAAAAAAAALVLLKKTPFVTIVHPLLTQVLCFL